MRTRIPWLLLAAALAQFIIVALPPGNDDLISVQSLALDLRRGDGSLLYPGHAFERNDEWVAHHEANLWALQSSGEPNWCFYPPLVPYLLAPLAERSPDAWRIAWGIAQLALTAAFALLIARLVHVAGLRVQRVLVFALVLGSYPVARSLELGQTSLFIAVLVWLGVYLQARGRYVLSAISVGAGAFVKPFLLVAVVPDLFRRHIRSAALTVWLVVILFMVSLLTVGWTAHVEYARFLATLGSSQTAYWGNQSLMAGLLRAFSTLPAGDYGFLTDDGLAIMSRVVALIVLTVAWLIQRRARAANSMMLVGLWLSAALLAMPLSWEHHLIFLLPVLALLWASPLSRWERAALAVVTAALEICWVPLYGESAPGRLAASLPLLGNLGLFVLLTKSILSPSSALSAEENPGP